jgi:hypothetical protein
MEERWLSDSKTVSNNGPKWVCAVFCIKKHSPTGSILPTRRVATHKCAFSLHPTHSPLPSSLSTWHASEQRGASRRGGNRGGRGNIGGVTSSVAAKMALFPPLPEDAEAGVTTLNRQPHWENVEVLRLRTRKRNCRNPPAMRSSKRSRPSFPAPVAPARPSGFVAGPRRWATSTASGRE